MALSKRVKAMVPAPPTNTASVASENVIRVKMTPKERMERELAWHKGMIEQQANQIKHLQQTAEQFLEGNRVSLEILGALIPQVSPVEQHSIHARLGVIEDILDGACTRYTD